MKSPTAVECIEDLELLQEDLLEPLQSQAYQITDPSCHLALHNTAGVLAARCSPWERYEP